MFSPYFTDSSVWYISLGLPSSTFLLSIVHEEVDLWYSQIHSWRQVISLRACHGLPCMSLMTFKCFSTQAISNAKFIVLSDIALYKFSLMDHYLKMFLPEILNEHVIS